MDRRSFCRQVGLWGFGATIGGYTSLVAAHNSVFNLGDASNTVLTVPPNINGSYILISSVSSARTQLFIAELQELFSRLDIESFESDVKVIRLEESPQVYHGALKRFALGTESLPEIFLFKIDDVDTGSHPYWDQHWISYAEDKVYNRGCYPISDSWWSVEGNFNPSLKKVQTHLLKSPNHTGGHFDENYVLSLKFAEAQSLHSDHHREMIHEGHVAWNYVNHSCPVNDHQ
jgi:hypothetical protein